MAMTVARPRGDLVTRIYYEIDEAPRTATPLCKQHGAHLAAALIRDLVKEDDD